MLHVPRLADDKPVLPVPFGALVWQQQQVMDVYSLGYESGFADALGLIAEMLIDTDGEGDLETLQTSSVNCHSHT